MKILEVSNSATEKQWIRLPWKIYKDDPNWIPHIVQDVRKVFDPEKNKLFKDGKAWRWLLLDDANKPIGRIAAFINNKTAYEEEHPVGGMGFFECVNDQAAANLLLDTAKTKLEAEGMEVMEGPINFGEKNQYWGLLIENFDDPPTYQNNYNPPYYLQLLENFGFQEYYKQLFFKRSMRVEAQGIFYRKYNQMKQDPKFEVRNVKGMSIKQIADDFRTIYNAAWVDHDNFKPMREETAMKAINAMKPIMDRDIIIYVYYDGNPIAFYISIPELNTAFKHINGNLNWWGKLVFLWYKTRKAWTTMNGIVFGVVKEWQGKGIEGAMIVFAGETLIPLNRYEDTVLTWIGDFNPKMIKVCKNLGSELYRTLATFRYNFDRQREFVRRAAIKKD